MFQNFSDHNFDFDDVFQRNVTNEAGGSPIYMAPETLIHKNFSFSSDIWALGCILYELCTLQPSFGSVQVGPFELIDTEFNSLVLN